MDQTTTAYPPTAPATVGVLPPFPYDPATYVGPYGCGLGSGSASSSPAGSVTSTDPYRDAEPPIWSAIMPGIQTTEMQLISQAVTPPPTGLPVGTRIAGHQPLTEPYCPPSANADLKRAWYAGWVLMLSVFIVVLLGGSLAWWLLGDRRQE